jgi:hypothetical protein
MAKHAGIAEDLVAQARDEAGPSAPASEVWAILQQKLTPSVPFEVHHMCYQSVYEGITDVKPAWIPSREIIERTNIQKMMTKKGFSSYQEFYDWSVARDTREAFWMESMEDINIIWDKKPTSAFDLSKGGPAHATYFPGGSLNISD